MEGGGAVVMKSSLICALMLFLFTGCTQKLPVPPVDNFDLNSYLGKWYEIARLDHSFERGLTQVTAEYSRREDGGVRVLNRGFSSKKGTWSDAEGKAYFASSPQTGWLKVSFFGPFYSPYVIFYLDPQYQYAYVAGPDLNYLWLLSRTPSVPARVYQHFLTTAEESGFAVNQLIKVEHVDNEMAAYSLK